MLKLSAQNKMVAKVVAVRVVLPVVITTVTYLIVKKLDTTTPVAE